MDWPNFRTVKMVKQSQFLKFFTENHVFSSPAVSDLQAIRVGITYCCFRRLLIFHWWIEIFLWFNLWFFNDPWRPSGMYYMCGYFMCLVKATVKRLVFISWWYLRRSLHILALDFMIQAFFGSSVVQVTQGVVPNFFYRTKNSN